MTKTKLSTYILLDRSASMGGARWENAIGSINAYVNELKKDAEIEGEVTVAAFDAPPQAWGNNAVLWNEKPVETVSFELLRKKKNLAKFKELKIDETTPRGGTPLYDATGLLLNLAEEKPNEKTIILIMTDGEENQSKVYNLQSIKDRLKGATNRGWEVIFLGAEFSVDNMARNFGINTTKTLSATRSADLGSTMQFYASGAAMYAKSGTAIDTTAMKSQVEK